MTERDRTVVPFVESATDRALFAQQDAEDAALAAEHEARLEVDPKLRMEDALRMLAIRSLRMLSLSPGLEEEITSEDLDTLQSYLDIAKTAFEEGIDG